MAKNTTATGSTIDGVTIVHPDNIGKGIKWNPTTKQYEVDIVDLTPINNRISGLSNEISGLSNEIDDLKNRPDRDTIYDDTALKNELTSLRNLVNSMQNTAPNVKYFKVPLWIKNEDDILNQGMPGETHIVYYNVGFNYTINENINNIQAITCVGLITNSKKSAVLPVDFGLTIKNNSNTSILVQGTSSRSDKEYIRVPDRYDGGHALITLYLK